MKNYGWKKKVVNTEITSRLSSWHSCFVLGSSPVQISAILIVGFRGFPQFLQADSETVSLY
jgi:hypothetical protein